MIYMSLNKTKRHLEKTVEHEKRQWNTIFESKLKDVTKKPKFSTFRDEVYYSQI